MTQQRVSDELLDALTSGEVVQLTREQLVRIVDYLPTRTPLAVAALGDGLYEVLSVRRQPHADVTAQWFPHGVTEPLKE